jgi:peptidoglycan-associated lipoprotein
MPRTCRQVVKSAGISRVALFCTVAALILAGCATTRSFRPEIDYMKAMLAEAKMARAETFAPEEYAKAEACLDWITHEATEYRPFTDHRISQYLRECRAAFQALQGRLAAAREVEPPVAVVPAPPPPSAPEVETGIYPQPGRLADALEALPKPEEAPLPVVVPAPPAEPPPPPPVAVVPAPPPAPEVETGIYPQPGRLADALEALPKPEEAPLPVVVPAPPPVAVVPAPPVEPPPAVVPPPPPVAPPLVAEPKPEPEKKTPLEDIFFDFDQALIRPDAERVLNQNAQWLRENPAVTITIEGHCDERGTHEYNLALGHRRAQATQEYLTAAGVDPNRMKIISYGKERPFVLGHDESAWRWNRRAHFVLR